MNKSRHRSLVVVPNRDYIFLCSIVPVWLLKQQQAEVSNVGFLVGRVLILVFCLLVRPVFLSLHQYHRLDHHPEALHGGETWRGVLTPLMSHGLKKKLNTMRHSYAISRNSTAVKFVIKPISRRKTHQLHSCELDECIAWGSDRLPRVI